MLNYKLTNSILTSKKTLSLISMILRIIPGNASQANNSKIFRKLDDLTKIDINSMKSNNNLLVHYHNSYKAKIIRKLFNQHSK